MQIKEISGAEFDPQAFIKEHWQKEALLIREFHQESFSPISPEELAGLACEDYIESRLIQELKSDSGESHWQMKSGPFSEDLFPELPESNWSLLVQSVDHWVLEVHDLIKTFSFLPAHILDDVMVSFAPKGGNVGPHFDYYDVFLVQGLGSREWRIGQNCDDCTTLVEDCDLSILKDFQEQSRFTLKPGDVLYLPSQIAHWGIALENCLTYSVGFRTPSIEHCLYDLSEKVCDTLNESERVKFSAEGNPFQLSHEQISKLHNQLQKHLLDEQNLTSWYGKFATEAKNPASIESPDSPITEAALRTLIQQNRALYKNEGSRFIFYSNADYVILFADGEEFKLEVEDKAFVDQLCKNYVLTLNDLESCLNKNSQTSLLLDLLNQGSLYHEPN